MREMLARRSADCEHSLGDSVALITDAAFPVAVTAGRRPPLRPRQAVGGSIALVPKVQNHD